MTRHRSQTDSATGLWRSRSEANIVAEDPGLESGPNSPGFEASPGESSPPLQGAGAGVEAYKATYCPGHEREETESSDDNGTQYSIHPPFDFPYFLLLQGYSPRQVRTDLLYTYTSLSFSPSLHPFLP